MTAIRRGTRENSLTPFHPLNDFQGTKTGRWSTAKPHFEEIEKMMTTEEFNEKPADDPRKLVLTPAEQALSALVFQLYHSNPGDAGTRSRVSDMFARRLRNDQHLALKLAQAIVPVCCPGFVGTVRGFAVEQPSLLYLILAGLMAEDKKQYELVLPDGRLNITELWARAAKALSQQGYKDVRYDHTYAEVADDVHRPGICGHGIDCIAVNHTMVKILEDNGLAGMVKTGATSWMATHQDEGGWVFSRAGIN